MQAGEEAHSAAGMDLGGDRPPLASFLDPSSGHHRKCI